MEIQKYLASVSILLLLSGSIVAQSTSTSSTSSTTNYCDRKNCVYCVASTKDATYKSCTECANYKSVLVNPSGSQTAGQTTGGSTTSSSVPNDVYRCYGRNTVSNCLVEYNSNDTSGSGCKFCKSGYKRQASGTYYSCVSHGVSNCIAWDDVNSRCAACDYGYEMTSAYICIKSSSRILQEASTSTTSNLLSNCKYHYYNGSALKCWTCEKRYGVSLSGTCGTAYTKGCRGGVEGSQSGTCQRCAFEAGWYSTNAGTQNGSLVNQICTFYKHSNTILYGLIYILMMIGINSIF